MQTKKLLLRLSKFFPKKYAKLNHDFVGLMVGKLKDETNIILLCLDFDEFVYDKLIRMDVKPDLIITHHPFVYGKKSFVLKNDPLKKDLFEKMLRLGIPIYSIHTNFDTGFNGMNDALSHMLELNNIYQPNECLMMRIGFLKKEMDVLDFAKYAINKLNVSYGQLINEGNAKIKKVAIIGGGGSREFIIAKKENADIYISGDAPHHVRRDIVNAKYNYLDVPHEIEKAFMYKMKTIINNFDNKIKIIIVDHEIEPLIILK